ncbi:hypothetical protein [Cerasicoccus maritimus]|uniref:hypothetical protein n=1 Tax=Cerasicoccus maritimus TaxID=490089 RepID=UPI00285282F8|nr:hypothetical protein [Cerasicoccus maritimus]
MIRVRRSSIRRFPAPEESALICFLSLTLGEGGSVRGCAVIRPPEAAPEFAQAAEQAARLATEVRAGSVFSFWLQMRAALDSWQKTNGKSMAAAAFGLALLERALMDAFCRAKTKPFAACLHDNDFKIELGKLCRPLKDRQPGKLLEGPLQGGMRVQLAVAPAAPMTELESAIAAGYRQFNLGLSGQATADLARLIDIAARLDQIEGRYAVSLEGNASFATPKELRELWEGMKAVPELKKLMRSVAYIEQPFPVDDSLTNAALALFAEWPERPPIIVDESDDSFGACARALEWGYAGTVFRAARGIIPGVVDASLLGARRDREPIGKWTIAGGPLSVGLPLAQLAELSANAAFGLGSCTITPGMLAAPTTDDPWRETLVAAHPETFDAQGALRVNGGAIALDEVVRAGFGCLPEIDATELLHA